MRLAKIVSHESERKATGILTNLMQTQEPQKYPLLRLDPQLCSPGAEASG